MNSTDFTTLHRDVIRGKNDGKIIWQPRIDAWLDDRIFQGKAFRAPFTGLSKLEVFRELNCSARIYEFNDCFVPVEPDSVRIFVNSDNGTTETVVETPDGTINDIVQKTLTSRYPLRKKWPIVTRDDMRVSIWRLDRLGWQWDQKKYDQLCKKWQGLGLPTMFMPRVTIQDLFINTMGVEAAIYASMDWPDLVKGYFAALDDCHDRLIDVINTSPIEVINFGDNIHCGTLSPGLFEEYVLPSYIRRTKKLHTAGKFVHAHWDGNTKSLLRYLPQTGLDGVEAVTPKPQGDVTLEELKSAIGDQLFFIDGIPAILFDDYHSIAELEDFTIKIIKMFSPKLILGISDEISSTGDLERIRVVGRIVEEYNRNLGK